MMKRILISWLTARAMGEPRTLRQTARCSVTRKVTRWTPRTVARRHVRTTLWKWL